MLIVIFRCYHWLAPAWILALVDQIIPIPGASKCRHLESNAGAIDVEFTRKDINRLKILL